VETPPVTSCDSGTENFVHSPRLFFPQLESRAAIKVSSIGEMCSPSVAGQCQKTWHHATLESFLQMTSGVTYNLNVTSLWVVCQLPYSWRCTLVGQKTVFAALLHYLHMINYAAPLHYFRTIIPVTVLAPLPPSLISKQSYVRPLVARLSLTCLIVATLPLP